MNKRIKQEYVLLVLHENDIVYIITKEEWNNDNWQNSIEGNLAVEVECFDDLDFATYTGELLAKKLNYEFAEYEESKEQIKEKEQIPFDIPEIRLITETNINLLSHAIDSKTFEQLEFNLKYCGRAFIDKQNQNIPPFKVKTENGKYKLI